MNLAREVIWPLPRRRLHPTVINVLVIAPVVALIGGLVIGPRRIGCHGSSKLDIARATAKDIAYTAYPQWAATHPEQRCPRSIDDLREFMNAPALTDPWSNPWRVQCGDDAPCGTKGVLITSSGEDGKWLTDDDIRSSDP